MTEPNEQELIASLNAELQKLGITYTVTEFDKKGGEIEKMVMDQVVKLVAEQGRPAKTTEVSGLVQEANRSTVQSALHRLVDKGILVGSPDFGYVQKVGTSA